MSIADQRLLGPDFIDRSSASEFRDDGQSWLVVEAWRALVRRCSSRHLGPILSSLQAKSKRLTPAQHCRRCRLHMVAVAPSAYALTRPKGPPSETASPCGSEHPIGDSMDYLADAEASGGRECPCSGDVHSRSPSGSRCTRTARMSDGSIWCLPLSGLRGDNLLRRLEERVRAATGSCLEARSDELTLAVHGAANWDRRRLIPVSCVQC